jgi:SAM-dependent methyltransferase
LNRRDSRRQPVQGHRRDHVGLGQQGRRGAAEPAGEQGRERLVVAVLELQDQAARRLVIKAGRPGAGEGVGLGDTGGATLGRERPTVHLEGRAAAVADRVFQKHHPVPGVGGEARGGRGLGTVMRQRRQQQIGHAPAQKTAETGGGFPSRAPDPILKAHELLLRSPVIFDSLRRTARLQRSEKLFSGADFLHARAAQNAVDSLDALLRDWPEAADLSAHAGPFAAALTDSHAAQRVGPVKTVGDRAARAAPGHAPLDLPDQSQDLIVSLMSLHWANDLPGALSQIRRALKPDGLFVGTLLGAGTLKELRAVLTEAELEQRDGAQARVSPFADGFDGPPCCSGRASPCRCRTWTA